MMSKIFIATLLVFTSCGKIQQVQDSFIAMSGNNDLRMVEVRLGAVYRNDPTSLPQGYDFIEFENTQYRIGSIDPEAQSQIDSLPRGQMVQVYFKGTFSKRSGVSTTHPTVEFDVIDIEAITKK
jgi:hypothetical protein